MKRRGSPGVFFALCLGLLVCLISALPLEASDIIHRRLSLFEVRDLLRTEGYQTDLDAGNDVCHFKMMGYSVQMFVADGGESIQFHCGWADTNATLRSVNAWNEGMRFSRAYIDSDGDPHLELDLDLAGGVTRARVIDFLATCRVSLERFVREVL